MKLSIITICYNDCNGLEKTARSIASQACQDFEWLVIDGGSQDRTVELIKSLDRQPDYWCSERDKGIYNAMNKGILHSHGEYLQFLNSGDTLVDSSIIADFHTLEWQHDIISGDILVDGSLDKARYTANEDELDYEYMALYTVLHPSTFIRKSLFDRCGLYDENYKIVSDWKFFLEALILHNCSYKRWKRFVADFNTGGISESEESVSKLIKEREEILDNFLPRVRSAMLRKNREIKEAKRPWRKLKRLFH